jgi:hypothetical protein
MPITESKRVLHVGEVEHADRVETRSRVASVNLADEEEEENRGDAANVILSPIGIMKWAEHIA